MEGAMFIRFLERIGRFVLKRLEEFGTIVLLYVELSLIHI